MSTSTTVPSSAQRAPWVTSPDNAALPVRMRALFARLRQRFAASGNTVWASSLQPDHLFASAMEEENPFDSGDASPVHAKRNDLMTRRIVRRSSEMATERAIGTEKYVWPISAHSVFSPAFPLCGMMLPPSGEGSMLAALLGTDQRGSHSRIEPALRTSAPPHRAA